MPAGAGSRPALALLPLAVALGALLGGCGGMSAPGRVTAAARATALTTAISTASCAREPLAAAPLPQETGIYHAGPLILAVGEDIAQHPQEWPSRRTSGSEAIAVLTATLVVARVAGRLVALSPPTDPPPDNLWLGYLDDGRLRHGALDVHIPPRTRRWYGTPEVWPRAQVTAFFPDGGARSLSATVLLHPGFG